MIVASIAVLVIVICSGTAPEQTGLLLALIAALATIEVWESRKQGKK